MTLKYILGFDDQNADTDISDMTSGPNVRTVGGTNGNGQFKASAQRFGTGLGIEYTGNPVVVGGADLGNTDVILMNVRSDVLAGNKITVGMAFRVRAYEGGTGLIGAAATDGLLGLSIGLTATGFMQIITDATIQATSAAPLISGVFTYLEFEFTFAAATVNHTITNVDVRADGAPFMSFAPAEYDRDYSEIVLAVVRGTTGTDITASTAIGGQIDIDDLYVLNDQGAENNAFLGEARVETFLPDTEDGVVGFTRTGGTNVADSVGIIDGTTFYGSSVLNDKAIFSSTDTLSSNPETIFGVLISNIVGKDNAGARDIAPTLKSGATEIDGATLTVAVSFTRYEELYEQDPFIAGAWLKGAVEAVSFGLEIKL